MSIRIQVEHVRDTFRLHVGLSLAAGSITGIFGPSGAGKSTLIRCIAGLETPQTAEIVVGDTVWQDTAISLPVHERPVGVVFQEPRLFPHLTVRGNLAYGERRSARAKIAFDDVVQLLSLESLLERQPRTLSGGEAKRVAIARALLSSPDLLLMDEPTASLDEVVAHELLRYLQRLRRELSIPVLYVSHDIDELCQLVDDIIVLDHGLVHASGPLQAVLSRADLPVIGGREAGAVLLAEFDHFDAHSGSSILRRNEVELVVAGKLESGSHRLRIRADDVSIALDRPVRSSILNILPCTIREITQDSSSSVLVVLDCDDQDLLARITLRSANQLGLKVGQAVHAQVKSIAVRSVA
ncbi:MAG: molybdenum ABC transporter ATP-binding protein [Pseudomonadota bacterium]